MLKAAGLHTWTKIRWWTSRWTASLLQAVRQPRARRPILETGTVFREVLSTEGKVVYGTHRSESEDIYQSQSDKEIASSVTLFREYVIS